MGKTRLTRCDAGYPTNGNHQSARWKAESQESLPLKVRDFRRDRTVVTCKPETECYIEQLIAVQDDPLA
jgi:hypothetical protein